jgi:hypothetical protein
MQKESYNTTLEVNLLIEDELPSESPFMGNHIVKTVRNLKR